MQAEDGSPIEGTVGADTIMFWSMADELENGTMTFSNYWMKKIANEYSMLDKTII